MMRRTRGWICQIASLAAVVLAPVAFSRPAAAIGLFNGSVLSVDGLTITVSGCALQLAGVVQSSCGTTSGNAYLELTALAGPNASIKIDKNGGGNIFSAASGTNLLYDATFVLTIAKSVATAKTTVNSAALTMAGSAVNTLTGKTDTNASDFNLVSAGETFLNAPGASPLTVKLATPLTSSTNFTSPVSSFSITKDLRLNTGSWNAGNTLTLAYVTQTYGPAPEPVSIGLFVLGLAGLGAVRRTRARGAMAV